MRSRAPFAAVLTGLLAVLAVVAMHAVAVHGPVVPIVGATATAVPDPGAGHGHHHGAGHVANQVADPVPQPAPGDHDDHGPLEQHVSMCAAVILAGVAAVACARPARRLRPGAVPGLLGALSLVDPPVPRPALALR